MKIITIASIKGGVSKTTLTAFLAQVLTAKGRRVLVIDSDSNNNLTDYFLRDTSFEEIDARNLYHLMTGEMTASEVTFRTSLLLDIIPCTLRLSRIAHDMAGKPNSMNRFARVLRSLDYDVIIIDTPPFLGYEMRAALNCADVVLTPINLTRWTLQALDLLQQEISELERPESPRLLAVPSIVTEKENEGLRTMPFTFSAHYVKKSATIRNAIDFAKPLKPDSPAWAYFEQIAAEVI